MQQVYFLQTTYIKCYQNAKILARVAYLLLLHTKQRFGNLKSLCFWAILTMSILLFNIDMAFSQPTVMSDPYLTEVSILDDQFSNIDDTMSARIIFKTPIKLEMALDFVKSSSVEVKFFIYKWNDHTAWYPASFVMENGADFVLQNHLYFLKSKLSQLKLMELSDGSPIAQSVRDNINSFKQQKQFLENTSTAFVMEMIVIGVKDQLLDLAFIPNIASIYIPNRAIKEHSTERLLPSGPPVPRPAGYQLYWSDNDYVGSFFFWHNSIFESPNIGYEHDIRVNPKDFWKDGSGIYYSNMPQPYIDTRCSDTGIYELYTIGSANSVALTNQTLYYTELPIDIQNQNISSASIKIIPQLGHYAGTTNYSTNDNSPAAEVAFCIVGCAPWVPTSGAAPYSSQACIFGTSSSIEFPSHTVNRNTCATFEYGEPGTCYLDLPTNGAPVGYSYQFRWQSSGYSNRFNLQISLNNSFTNLVLNYTGGCCDQTAKTVNGFVQGQTYYWRVREEGVFTGWKPWSNSRYFYRPLNVSPGDGISTRSIVDDSLTSSIEDISISKEISWPLLSIKLYPNPVDQNGEIRIVSEAEVNGMVEIRLLNSLGLLIERRTLLLKSSQLETRFEANSLIPGLYIVQVSVNGEITHSYKVQMQ